LDKRRSNVHLFGAQEIVNKTVSDILKKINSF
jgi:hypothetical protein